MIGGGTLQRPVATAIIAALLVCAAAAWLLTAQQAASMAGMGGMATPGAGLFLVTWVVMMVAMMFPTIAPMVVTHAGIIRSRGEGTIPTVVFVLGYLVVWTVRVWHEDILTAGLQISPGPTPICGGGRSAIGALVDRLPYVQWTRSGCLSAVQRSRR